jgi:hypothetical protein
MIYKKPLGTSKKAFYYQKLFLPFTAVLVISKFLQIQPEIQMFFSISRSKSPAVGDFYGTGIEVWAGFGQVHITEKKNLG